MLIVLLLLTAVLLAWSNGANDNFKGVATLYGSATTSYRAALIWATATTLAGSLVSIALASALAKAFSGKGVIPDELVSDPALLVSVGAGGALTVFLATILGMPTSTTHALTGGLVGAGLVAGPALVNWNTLLTKFAQPLLLSPIAAVVIAVVLYLIFSRTRRALGVERETCVCIGEDCPQPVPVTVGAEGGTMMARSSVGPGSVRTMVSTGTTGDCTTRYNGRVVGVSAQKCVDVVHFGSAGAVCFARAVNDTPKIAALILAVGVLQPGWALLVVAIPMAVGGVVSARKVAETMSKRITDLNSGQGLTANLTTAGLVLFASRLGLPVSTTHVSCSSIFGIGMVNKRRHWKSIGHIGLTWVTTLPLGIGIGAGLYALLRTT